MLLGSYDLPRPRGVYWTPSPIFLHAEACLRYDAPDAIAPIVLANPLVSVRAYDAAELCLYDLGAVTEGEAVAPALARVLADPRTRHINIHTARPGCLLTAVVPEFQSGSAARSPRGGGATFAPFSGCYAMTEKEPTPAPGTTDAVRQGTTTGHVRWILIVSLVLVIVAFLAAGFLTR